MPADCREAIQWFVNNCGLYIGSTRGLFLSDWNDEHQPLLEAAIINLKSRGIMPLVITGETLFRQAEYLWQEAQTHTSFGRPLASKVELELTGADLVIVEGLEAPENAAQLWYLYSHLFYPRSVSGKTTLVTTPLAYQELMRYGEACPDGDFRGKPINWENLVWLMEATMINLDMFRTAREEGLPPLLKAEYELYAALKEKNLDADPQHVLGDYLLDFAMSEGSHRLNIEVEIFSLAGHEVQLQEAKRNLMLLSDSWQILKFTTSEILANRAACAEVAEDVWRTGRKKGVVGSVVSGKNVSPMPELPVSDEIQQAAIMHGAGPAAVTGGAGTGKTACIVQRTIHLLSQGVNPESILLITHNPDTLKNLKRDLEAVLEKTSQRLNIYSWHDLGTKLLKENLPAIRRKPPLKVDPNPQKVIQRQLAKFKKEIDPTKLELLAIELDEFYVAAVIAMFKTLLISPQQVKDEAKTDADQLIAKVYQGYEEQLQKANRVDRDDLIALAVQILLNHQDIRIKYNHQFEHVLADDYQDATVAQDMLARLLAAPQDNLYIVGDEDETMTEARNACPDLLTDVSIKRPHTRCYTLEKNWRSHPAIMDHARYLLTGLMRRKISKDLISAWGTAPAGAIIGPTCLADENEEAAWVAREIQILLDSGREPSDIAVLFRHPSYASLVEEALSACGVRFEATNADAGLVPDEVGDMLAFLKLVQDPDGPRARESFERVCQLRVKEVDPKLSATIASFAEANNLSYLKAVEIYSEATADQVCRELEQLVRMIRNSNQGKLPPAESIALFRRAQRLNDYYKSLKVPPGVKYEPLKKLSQLEEDARQFTNVGDFLRHMSGEKGGGAGGAKIETGVALKLILDAKGMEFPLVFVIGLAEGVFPAEPALDPEEERRMAYVAFTRARELLYLSHPASFTGMPVLPSRFLVDARFMPAPTVPYSVPTVVMPAPVMQQPPPPQPMPAPAPMPAPVVQQPPPPQPMPAPAPMPAPVVQQPPPPQPMPAPVVQQPPPPQPMPAPASMPAPFADQPPVPKPMPAPVVQQPPAPAPMPAPFADQPPVPKPMPSTVVQQPPAPAPVPAPFADQLPVPKPMPAPQPAVTAPVPAPLAQEQPPTAAAVEPAQPVSNRPGRANRGTPMANPQEVPVAAVPKAEPAAPLNPGNDLMKPAKPTPASAGIDMGSLSEIVQAQMKPAVSKPADEENPEPPAPAAEATKSANTQAPSEWAPYPEGLSPGLAKNDSNALTEALPKPALTPPQAPPAVSMPAAATSQQAPSQPSITQPISQPVSQPSPQPQSIPQPNVHQSGAPHSVAAETGPGAAPTSTQGSGDAFANAAGYMASLASQIAQSRGETPGAKPAPSAPSATPVPNQRQNAPSGLQPYVEQQEERPVGMPALPLSKNSGRQPAPVEQPVPGPAPVPAQANVPFPSFAMPQTPPNPQVPPAQPPQPAAPQPMPAPQSMPSFAQSQSQPLPQAVPQSQQYQGQPPQFPAQALPPQVEQIQQAEPVQPAYQAPAQPPYQAPAQPAYQAPAQPPYQAPAQPAYQAPAQPAYQAPAQPAYQAPAQPAYQAPAEPSYQAPAQPPYQAPAQPPYQAPAEPPYQAPAQPPYQAPEQLSYQAPAQPVQPAQPDAAYYASQGHLSQVPTAPLGPVMTPDGHPACPSCGDLLDGNARFCGGCGYSLPERIPMCGTCGIALEPGAKFCGECGMPTSPQKR